MKKIYFLNNVTPKTLTPGRLKVLEYLKECPNSTLKEISDTVGVSKAVIYGLIKKNIIQEKIIKRNIHETSIEIIQKKNIIMGKSELDITDEILTIVDKKITKLKTD